MNKLSIENSKWIMNNATKKNSFTGLEFWAPNWKDWIGSFQKGKIEIIWVAQNVMPILSYLT